MLDNTFKHVQDISWSGTKLVYVLDDSARESVRDLAAQYGFRYVARANRGELKKAGNLINAFDLSSGDFIVVLDADFAARRDFLYETMPYFSDPLVGIVQTAQFFDTRDLSFSYIQRYAGLSRKSFSGSFSRPGIVTRRRSVPGRTLFTGAPRWRRLADSRGCR